MKKLLATAAIAATLTTGTVAQADAPELVPQMSTQTITENMRAQHHQMIVPIMAMLLFVLAASGGSSYSLPPV